MSRDRAPMSDETVLQAGRELWARNAGRLWANIEPTERVLMSYAQPGAAWRAADHYLLPTSVSGLHHARDPENTRRPTVIGAP